jgi:hypothetical protein
LDLRRPIDVDDPADNGKVPVPTVDVKVEGLDGESERVHENARHPNVPQGHEAALLSQYLDSGYSLLT